MQSGTCKHYNGDYHNKTCLAGVCYRDVTTEPDRLEGRALRKPCHSMPFPNSSPSQLEHFNNRGKCAKYEEPTREELVADEAAHKAAVDRLMKSVPLIAKVKREHKGQSWKGTDVCPVCGKTIHLSHAAYNGHVLGKCETEGCLSWME